MAAISARRDRFWDRPRADFLPRFHHQISFSATVSRNLRERGPIVKRPINSRTSRAYRLTKREFMSAQVKEGRRTRRSSRLAAGNL